MKEDKNKQHMTKNNKIQIGVGIVGIILLFGFMIITSLILSKTSSKELKPVLKFSVYGE